MGESLRRTSGLEPSGEDASQVRLSHAPPPALAGCSNYRETAPGEVFSGLCAPLKP